jgi:8-oxo-dGTP pyrophosphatase MutT (NUDIX family)
VLPDPGVTLDLPPRPWRLSARLLVVDDDSRLLMLRAHDPSDAAAGEWWEIPGGGVEPGEDTVTAAIRETAEETGYVVPAAWVGDVCWHGETTYTWLGRRHWAEMVMHVARVREPLTTRATAWAVEEESCFLDVSWVPLGELLDRRGRCFPAALAAHLPRLLDGERIDAGFTVWS